MKGTRFLSMRTTLAVCVLALVLVAEAGFISAEATMSYGYAKLRDAADDLIKSDVKGQYIDKNIVGASGEDMVEITTDGTNVLVSSWTILGIVERQSTRRVHFLFDVYSDALNRPGEGKAVYDILVWTDSSKTTRRDLNAGNGTVHFRVVYYRDSADDNIAFIIDPGWDGKDPNAITQTAVNNFYRKDKNEIYMTGGYNHVIYFLAYSSGISPAPGSAYPTWTFEPSGSPVVLYVMKKVGRVYERMDLATYGALPFELTMSLNPIQAAPRKHNTLSTSWGEIKTK